MCSEHIEGDEWGTYVALIRAAPPERGMPYRARAPRVRSHRSSRGWGKPIAWRRVAGRRRMNGRRVRDAHRPEPTCLSSTGELIDIERVPISSEGGRRKRTRKGTSLAAYPTSSPVWGEADGKGRSRLPVTAVALRAGKRTPASAVPRRPPTLPGALRPVPHHPGRSGRAV
jgi:hypothetical protein